MFLTESFKTIALGIPGILTGRPSNWPQNIRTSMSDFFRSDHYRFWDAKPSLPAVFVTDSANFRGFMQQCYHKDCDDISHVTPEMMTFMGRTTDSVVQVATNMTNEKCQMKKTGRILNVFRSQRQGRFPFYRERLSVQLIND